MSNHINVMFELPVTVYKHGAGISKGGASKGPGMVIVPLLQVSSNKTMADIKTIIKKCGQLSSEFNVVRNRSPDELAEYEVISNVADFLNCHRFSVGGVLASTVDCYILEKQASYSNLIYAQLKPFLHFPQNPNIRDYLKDHHTSLLDLNPPLLNNAIAAMKVEIPPDNESFQQSLLSIVNALQVISNHTKPKLDYSKKLRRTIIDIPLYLCLGLLEKSLNVKREIGMEENLVSSEDQAVAKCLKDSGDMVGRGPVDYLIEGIVFATGAEEDEDTENVEDTEVEGKVSGSSEHFPPADLEANVKVDDAALYQVIGQAHDLMFVKQEGRKRTVQGDAVGRLIVQNKKVIAILSTGHSWEVYRCTAGDRDQSGEVAMNVEFMGRTTMQVLRYLERTQRTSSHVVTASEDRFTLEPQQVQDVMYLILAVLTNKF